MSATAIPATVAHEDSWPPPGQAWYAVGVFGLTLFTLFAAAPVTGLVLEYIKADFKLNDKQVALVVSSAGMWVNAIASLPISRLADRYSRRLIIAAGLLVLGFSSIASALVTTITMFFIVRLIGGLGGAGNGPATFSMLGDMFPPAKLPRAMAIMNFGFMFAIGLPLILGATMFGALQNVSLDLPLVGSLKTWQVLLLILAIPDLVLGVLILTTVREPTRRARSVGATVRPPAIRLREVFGYLWANKRAFWPMYVGLALNCLALGTSAWMTPFYQRTHGWGPEKFGWVQGWVYVLLAPCALLLGGWLAEKLAKRGFSDANLRMVFWASLLHIPFAVSFPIAASPWLALACVSLSTCTISIGTGPQNAAFQSIVPNEMRAQITASFLFVFTATAAAGPVIVGWLTDDVFKDPKDLRYSLFVMHAITGPLAAIVFWIGLKEYGRAVEQVRAWRR
jgi:MFS family permease